MKNKKLEKQVKFTFKRKELLGLTKEEMRKINGGSNPVDGNGGPQSTTICDRTLQQTQ